LPVPAFSSALAWAALVMVITLRLLHRLHRSWRTPLLVRVPDMPGLAAIGTRRALVMPGAQAIGLGHRIRMPTGLGRAITGTATTAGTGGGDYQADLSFQTSRATTLALPPCS
jgi:hypothetical protein